MRVIIAHPYIYNYHLYGGAERRLYFLSKALVRLGISVEYVTSKIIGVGKCDFNLEGIKLKPLPILIKPFQPAIGAREPYLFSYLLSKYLDRIDFDILHTPGGLFYALKNKRRPILFESYDLECMYDVNPIRLLLKRVGYNLIGYYSILKRVLQNVDVIAVEDPVQREKLVKFCQSIRKKIVYLPTGVDIFTINSIIEGSNLKSRQKLGFSEDDFILISVNRFYKHKGLDYLIEAFRLVKQKINNAKLILIGGSGPYLQNIIEKISKLGLSDDIKIMKNIPFKDIINYYIISDVYVCPLLIEGTSNSILDAMACGLPIISTIMPWLVRDGINGYIIPPANAKDMALAILRIYDKDACKKFGRESKCIVRDYSWEKIARKSVSIYEKII